MEWEKWSGLGTLMRRHVSGEKERSYYKKNALIIILYIVISNLKFSSLISENFEKFLIK